MNSVRQDTVFVLAGDGPIRSELKELMPHAVFLGNLDMNVLAEAYASSDLFLFPSTTETFGNVVLEAMACGLPAVCSDKGGAGSSINNNVNGFVCTSGNVDDFSEKINCLLDNKDRLKSFGKSSAEFASKQNWDFFLKKQFDFYKAVLSRKHILDKAA